MSGIQDFIVSRVRVKLLSTFLSQPGGIFYVRQLVRDTDEEINAVRRELLHLAHAGMVKSEKRGNRIYFWFNHQYKYYPELLRIVMKTSGLGGDIIQQQQNLGKIKFAFVSGRFARVMQHKSDQVDLLLVGDVVMPQLAALVKAEEARRKTEVNYSVMSEEEFQFRKNRRDPFITEVLMASRIMLVGDEEELIRP